MKKFIYLLVSVMFCLTLANCSLFGGGNKKDEEPAADGESADYYEAGGEDSANAGAGESAGDDASEGSSANASAADDDTVDSDVAFGEPADVPETAANDAPDMTPETPEVMPESEPTKNLASASFKQGMYDFDEDCQMREDPDDAGAPAGNIKAPKKLWVEPFDGGWLRVYKKSGPVFIKRNCLEK